MMLWSSFFDLHIRRIALACWGQTIACLLLLAHQCLVFLLLNVVTSVADCWPFDLMLQVSGAYTNVSLPHFLTSFLRRSCYLLGLLPWWVVLSWFVRLRFWFLRFVESRVSRIIDTVWYRCFRLWFLLLSHYFFCFTLIVLGLIGLHYCALPALTIAIGGLSASYKFTLLSFYFF